MNILKHTEKQHKGNEKNHQIVGIKEEEESQVNGIDSIFNEIIEEKFPQNKERHTHSDRRNAQNTK